MTFEGANKSTATVIVPNIKVSKAERKRLGGKDKNFIVHIVDGVLLPPAGVLEKATTISAENATELSGNATLAPNAGPEVNDTSADEGDATGAASPAPAPPAPVEAAASPAPAAANAAVVASPAPTPPAYADAAASPAPAASIAAEADLRSPTASSPASPSPAAGSGSSTASPTQAIAGGAGVPLAAVPQPLTSEGAPGATNTATGTADTGSGNRAGGVGAAPGGTTAPPATISDNATISALEQAIRAKTTLNVPLFFAVCETGGEGPLQPCLGLTIDQPLHAVAVHARCHLLPWSNVIAIICSLGRPAASLQQRVLS